MRTVVLVALVAWSAATSWAQTGKEAKPETLLRWSFVGTKQLATEKNLTLFNEVRSLPEAGALGDAAMLNLARRAANRFPFRVTNPPAKIKLPAGADASSVEGGIAALIQPLLSDLVQYESRFELLTHGAENADWRLALKLPDDRVSAWSKHLTQLASASGLQGAKESEKTWVASRDQYKLSFSRAKDWTVIQGGYGETESKAAKDFQASLGKRSGKNALDADVNTPLLGKIWSAPQLAHYPRFSLKAEPRRDGFHSELVLEYPQDLGIKPEKWNVPTSLITEPLIGFTAIQGIQKKLQAWEQFRALGAKQTPNQVFMWSQSVSPFSVNFAAEVKNPAEVVTNATRFLEKTPLPSGALFRPTNVIALIWAGLPIAAPHIEVAPKPSDSYLLGGLFRARPVDAEPTPKELLEQLNQKNLVYYDWEISSERLQQWIPIRQFFYLVGGKFLHVNEAPSAKFLQALVNRIGNTVTTGTLESQRSIKFVRQSQLGVSSAELLLLAHYLDGSDLVPFGMHAPKDRTTPPPPAAQ